MVPGMIDSDYFKRQARTLRKMVRVTRDLTVAERLSDMADDFEARADDSAIHARRPEALRQGANGDKGHG